MKIVGLMMLLSVVGCGPAPCEDWERPPFDLLPGCPEAARKIVGLRADDGRCRWEAACDEPPKPVTTDSTGAGLMTGPIVSDGPGTLTIKIDALGRVHCAPDARFAHGGCDCSDAYWQGFRDGEEDAWTGENERCWSMP